MLEHLGIGHTNSHLAGGLLDRLGLEESQLQNPAITDTVNNGINEFIIVLKRANYILPSRRQRSFPLLPGRDRVLGSPAD